MYKLIVKDKFDSAHQIHGHIGKCAGVHGHTWDVEAVFSASMLDAIGIAADFGILKAVLKAVIEELDHTYLNDLIYFKVANPTAENISSLIYTKIKEKLAEEDLNGSKLTEVRVWESPDACCIYSE